VTNIGELIGVFEALSACKMMDAHSVVRVDMGWSEFNALAGTDGYMEENLRYAGYSAGQGAQNVLGRFCTMGVCGIQVGRTTAGTTIASRNDDGSFWNNGVTTRGLLSSVPRGAGVTARETAPSTPVFRYSDQATISRHWVAATRGQGVFRNAQYQFSMDVSTMMELMSDIFDQGL